MARSAGAPSKKRKAEAAGSLSVAPAQDSKSHQIYFQPSLPQLLAIDKGSESLHAKIHKLAQLVGLHDALIEIEREDSLNEYSRGDSSWRGGHTRNEWAFKWLLEKLRLEGPDRDSARASPAVWRLLTLLLQTIPVSVVARCLLNGDFISILEKTLVQLFHEASRSDSTSVATSPASAVLEPSKKRKRGTDAHAEPSQQSMNVDTSGGAGPRRNVHAQAVHQIAVFLHAIHELTSNKEMAISLVSREQLKSVLRCSTVHASAILKICLSLMNTLWSESVIDLETLLDVALWIWESRQLDAQDSNASMATFCSTSLLAVCRIQVKLAQPRGEVSRLSQSQGDSLKQKLRRLLLGHFLAPAKQAFDMAQASKKPETFDHTAIRHLLQPLRDAIADKDDDGEDLANFLPAILQLAIRSARKLDAGVKRQDIPWFENVLAVLSECAGLPLVQDRIIEISRDRLKVLSNMLHLIQTVKIQITSDMLVEILRRYWIPYTLDSDPSNTLQSSWRLLTSVLKLDGDIFLPSRSRANVNPNHVQIDFRSRLIEAMSSLKLDECSPNMVKLIVDDVAMNLMRVHMKARDLKSFVATWSKELSLHANRVQPGHSSTTLIWAHKSLRAHSMTVLSAGFTTMQYAQLINTYILPLSKLSSELQSMDSAEFSVANHSIGADALAAAYILEVLLSSITNEDVIKELQPPLSVMFNTLVALMLTRKIDDEHTSAFWYLLLRVLEALSVEADAATMDARLLQLNNTGLLKQALEEIHRGENLIDPAADGASYSVDPAAPLQFYMLTLWAYRQSGSEIQPNVQDLLIALLKLEDTSIDVRPEFAAPRAYLLLLCLNFIRYPELLLALPAEHRKELLATFLTMLVQDSRTQNTQQINDLHDVLQTLLATIFDLGSAEVRDDLFSGFVMLLEQHYPLSSQAYSLLQYIMPQALQRKQREQFLDMYLPFSEHSYDTSRIITILPLALQLLRLPCLTSKICSQPLVALQLAEVIDNADRSAAKPEADSTITFAPVVEAVLHQVLADQQSERKEAFSVGFESALLSSLDAKTKTKRSVPGLANAVLGTYWLEQRYDTTAKPETLPLNLVQAMQNLWLRISTADTTSSDALRDESNFHWQLQRFIKVLEKHEIKPAPGLRALNFDWTSTIQSLGHCASVKRQGGVTADVVEYDVPDQLTPDDPLELIRTSMLTPAKPRDTLRLRRYIIDNVGQRPTEERADILHTLAKTGLDVEKLHVQLDILRTLPHVAVNADYRLELQAFTVGILREIKSTTSVHTLRRHIQAVRLVLTEKQWMLTQYAVDTMITTLTNLVSPSAAIVSGNGADVYHDVCSVLRTMIILHRRSLTGRMQLILPLLQALLTCLFTPHSASAEKHRPPWLGNQSPGALTVSHAKSYARVLTSLCSPTVASVAGIRTSAHRRDLVDQTKTARERLGLVTPLLLTHFCATQLDASVKPEIRKALSPGLWSAIDVISEEGLKTMNEAMGRDTRALWHVLLAEYRKANDRE